MRLCPTCDESKPPSEFFSNCPRCKPCEKARRKEVLAANPEKTRADRQRTYYKHHAHNLEVRRNRHLRSTFGISAVEYDALFDAQGGKCAVCRQPESDFDPRAQRIRKLAVDHCHATGRIRGLLCKACNVALGYLKDDPVRIAALGSYISGGVHV